jgi:hypothetical protein
MLRLHERIAPCSALSLLQKAGPLLYYLCTRFQIEGVVIAALTALRGAWASCNSMWSCGLPSLCRIVDASPRRHARSSFPCTPIRSNAFRMVLLLIAFAGLQSPGKSHSLQPVRSCNVLSTSSACCGAAGRRSGLTEELRCVCAKTAQTSSRIPWYCFCVKNRGNKGLWWTIWNPQAHTQPKPPIVYFYFQRYTGNEGAKPRAFFSSCQNRVFPQPV